MAKNNSTSKNKKLEIKSVFAYQVFDSRGFPTVACEVILNDGSKGLAMVPSGASTGEKEALELRDGGTKYHGKGVSKAVNNINKKIAPAIIGCDASLQKEIDEEMIRIDGTSTKSKLGANAILAVSMAICRAAAESLKLPLYKYIAKKVAKIKSAEFILPVPMLNVINGGAHADNTIDFQEFMIMPVGAKTMAKALQIASEVFHSLQKILKSKKLNTNKGDEGGFAPNLKSAEEALDLMSQAVTEAGYTLGKDVAFALDCAASEFYNSEKKAYVFKKAVKAGILTEEKGTKTTEQLVDYLEELTNKYPIISIEDGLDENDWDGMKLLTERIGKKVQIVGDDTYCTNPELAAKGVSLSATNSVLIKLNQIGTLTETISTINIAKKANWTAVVSHRSGETEDSFISDLAVALSTGQIKTGSMSRSERIAKYNRLLAIEIELDKECKYLGNKTFYNLTPVKNTAKK
ncbi:phosphopyruvate hydratase [Mycoplasma bradburyae]|uniref:Enolase n=1 Tax=Mycoplasma bradburyae TaxID=2963128 RepID=A0AAW6HNS0_9MOLU|nr:phosphopyruvate hydratase [Mycoplasma bradburyae]MDC4181696.1 phosphopyruvate hydratase [Mycoplasma bradburyae]MDC4182813.1 phosphopyruvate hydratase [Mycoplasma bradburyae]MDC4183487.1 phosphopyruvate hydratase [Mycoplasma bradburyae]MDC4183871.1 phosphopyruvate hydratase [Mycoplasma bradburyae]UTS69884.1 phosphopyruvate hydratase [Mycoplasma bradburyae]